MIISWRFDPGLPVVVGHPDFLMVAQELLRAHRAGHHLLVIDRQVATQLGELDFSIEDKALVERLRSQYTQTGGLPENSPIHLEVINSFEELIAETPNTVRASLASIQQSRVLERSILLVENLARDGRTYSEIIATTGASLGRGAVSLDLHHGGGQDIGTVLEYLLGQKRIVFCLVDSDADSPLAMSNAKLAQAKQKLSNAAWPFGRAGSPPCREVENLLPMELVFQLPSGLGHVCNQRLLDISQRERNLGIATSECYWSYFDIKLGASYTTIQNMAPPEAAWVQNRLAAVGEIVDPAWSIAGYGDRVIHQLIANGGFISEFRKLIRTENWRGKFGPFFSFLVWFFLGQRRLIT